MVLRFVGALATVKLDLLRAGLGDGEHPKAAHHVQIIGYATINAGAETVASKPAFRTVLDEGNA